MSMTAHEYAAGLRQIADWYEEHPMIPVPHIPDIQVFNVHTQEDAASVARALGHVQKRPGLDTGLLVLYRPFGAINLEFYFTRSVVCTRRVTGTVEVPEVVIPAHTRAAHTREIVEWDCGSILAREDAEVV